MSKPTLGLCKAAALTTDLLRSHLPPKWFGGRARQHVGLAISGGVDSMALATLCSRLHQTQHTEAPSFTAFIVDHGLRSGSDGEAMKVASYLKQLNMPSKILTLDREQYGNAHAAKQVESIARKLRYRAMGAACLSQGISSLLFAHHADDQAETTLMRLANNYLGKGLAGMQAEARIPECEDMYGVRESGTPRVLRREHVLLPHRRGVSGANMLVESGGIAILRPLLHYTKDRLVATCEQAGVEWVEDHTNKDPSLTLRNTIRQLHEQDLLPTALRRPSLCAIATRTSDKVAQQEVRAHEFFRRFGITIDPRSGHAICSVDHRTAKEISEAPDVDHLKAILLRKLLFLVAPASSVDLSTLEAASSTFLAHQSHVQPVPIMLAGAAAVRLNDSDTAIPYQLRRTPPPRNGKGTRLEVKISLPVQPHNAGEKEVSWSDWHLWDERYWIRVGALPCNKAQANNAIVVRMLTPEDIGGLRRDSQAAKTDLQERLSSIKGVLRTTLPVIVQKAPGDGDESTTSDADCILALPSLGWSRDGWLSKDALGDAHDAGYCYDIRYKHIDDSLTMPVGSEPSY